MEAVPNDSENEGESHRDICIACGCAISEFERLILVRGRVRDLHCSEACLRETLANRRAARATARRRWVTRALLVAVPLLGAAALHRRYHAPPPVVIVGEAPEPLPEPPRPEPVRFGPAWPPTDADWDQAFRTSRWVYPLPGPIRRTTTIEGLDARRLFPEPAGSGAPASICHVAARCAVDLGGELWGEHVYAAHDGVVVRALGEGGDDRGGGLQVRLAHFGGMVFTQYFHLAAVPRAIVRGARVRAGDLVGLVGDTGTEGALRHLTFALSTRPSAAFAEEYRDPTAWMEAWPLRLVAHGSVAGLVPTPKVPATGRRAHRDVGLMSGVKLRP